MQKDHFFSNVHEVVRLIPTGRATTYGSIARYLGGSARMVGWAMNAAHATLPYVPAHRVVNRNGLLSGKMHFGTQNQMQVLLENEGVEVQNDVVQNFTQVFWDVEKELAL